MGSAVVAVVFNAIHPRASAGSLNDTAELLRLVSGSRSWRLVHLASVAATLVGFAAIVAILWSVHLGGGGSNRWPAISLVVLVVTTPILLLSVGIDGFAMKTVADRWAAVAANPTQQDSLVSVATGMRSVDVAVLNLVMVGQFGITAVLLGWSTWRSRLYGPAIGAVAVAGGVLGMACGVLQALSGKLTTLSYLVLLTVSLALFTIWLTLASFRLLQRAGEVTAP